MKDTQLITDSFEANFKAIADNMKEALNKKNFVERLGNYMNKVDIQDGKAYLNNPFIMNAVLGENNVVFMVDTAEVFLTEVIKEIAEEDLEISHELITKTVTEKYNKFVENIENLNTVSKEAKEDVEMDIIGIILPYKGKHFINRLSEALLNTNTVQPGDDIFIALVDCDLDIYELSVMESQDVVQEADENDN
jgi:hypothetical protein